MARKEGFLRFFLAGPPLNPKELAFFRSAGVSKKSEDEQREHGMKNEEEIILKVTKEIVVKFIEVGRLSVNSFEEVWNQVHGAVKKSLKESAKD